MGSFLNTLMLLAQVLKALPALIDALETLFPEKGQGVTKLEVLKGAIQQTVSTVEGGKDTFEKIWNMITPIVSTLVTKNNNNGTFVK